jgi:alpha-L-fucosidase
MKLPDFLFSPLALLLLACSPVPVLSSTNPPQLPAREPQSEFGITQLPNEKLDWLLNAKFGMFVHWGLYSVPARGEWFMEKSGILPDVYQQYAYPAPSRDFFDAANYHPDEWAALAKSAGMKWITLTARHHEGFCLFDSPFPTAFTSMQTLHRDLFADYVRALRAAGLKVGVYYSPLSWRYPGYFDWTGKNCLPNPFGFTTNPSHFQNARLMKEENYVNVKTLLTRYGKIDEIFWDGGWLGLRGSDADAAFFHEPGQFLSPQNPWPIDKKYQDFDPATGKPLSIMGMVRKYQPDAITNSRYGWIGDILEEEGPRSITGPIRSRQIYEKCLTIQPAAWGYDAQAIADGKVMTADQIITYLADCVIRNMVLLANVSPDCHGNIPALEQQRLLEVGAWLQKNADSIYNTRAGPWQPVDRQFGYCFKGSTIFIHILKAYKGTDFTVPALGDLHPTRVYEVFSGNHLPYDSRVQVPPDFGELSRAVSSPAEALAAIHIHQIDRTLSPADTVIAVTYDHPIDSIWKN